MQLAMQELIETQGITPEDIMAKMQDPRMLKDQHKNETSFYFAVGATYNTSERK